MFKQLIISISQRTSAVFQNVKQIIIVVVRATTQFYSEITTCFGLKATSCLALRILLNHAVPSIRLMKYRDLPLRNTSDYSI